MSRSKEQAHSFSSHPLCEKPIPWSTATWKGSPLLSHLWGAESPPPGTTSHKERSSTQGTTRHPEARGRRKARAGRSCLSNKSLPSPGFITQLSRLPPPPPSSPLALSLGWPTLGKQVLHYAALPGMRSVLVSNSRAQQAQGHRPGKAPSCSAGRKAWASTRRHHWSHGRQARRRAGPASSRVWSTGPAGTRPWTSRSRPLLPRQQGPGEAAVRCSAGMSSNWHRLCVSCQPCWQSRLRRPLLIYRGQRGQACNMRPMDFKGRPSLHAS